MKTKLLFSSLLIFLFNSIVANAQWIRQSNGLPETWNLGYAIDASDSNNVVFSTTRYDWDSSKSWYDLYLTNNGGNLWNRIGFPDTIKETAVDVTIIGSSHIWAATDLGKIIATTDGGLNWKIQFDDTSKTGFMNYIEMFDELNGVAMGDVPYPFQKKPALFLRTTNGGNTWVKSTDTTLIDMVSGDVWLRLDFVNPNVGYFYESGLNPQRLLKTNDGGDNWQIINYPARVTVVKCFDENLVLLHSNDIPNIRRTTNGGNTWQGFNLIAGWGTDFEFIPGDASKVFFTDGDNLFFSSDTGRTWQSMFVDNIDIQARDIVFADKNNGWILGDSGRVYKTSSGGLNDNYIAADYIAANEIFMWVGNNGMGSHDPLTDGSGFYWPGGKDATTSAIFEDGLNWGGKVNGEVRVNGSTYRQGLLPGYIMSDGTASNPLETKSKIFKLKKNWQLLPPSEERNRYAFDYANWPVDVGAPWEDKNGDGIYTSGIDEPKIIGDETLFFVANDLDTMTSRYPYGSDPIGLEVQTTIFGYNTELLKDVVFKKYKIINKSSNAITDMYLCYWTDDDLGFASDDYIGCDTILNLGFTFNSDNNDQGYYGTPPPAVGHMILQPPIIQSDPADSAHYGDGWINGYRNLQMNAFVPSFCCGNSEYFDPALGEYEGTLQFYNIMQGLLPDGDPMVDPNTSLVTPFCTPGDPIAKVGWFEGGGWPGGPNPGDRYYRLSSGPFNMAPNDTQEVVIAILIKKGTDNLNSITELKNYAAQIQHWYDNDFVTSIKLEEVIVPMEYFLSQNYPNPFNPTTKIKYSIASAHRPLSGGARGGFVTLKIYDVLGNEVETLVNEEKPEGNYEVEFNGTKLSSGVYFYRLIAGSFIQTKKMILVK